jgi:hypothetical protein
LLQNSAVDCNIDDDVDDDDGSYQDMHRDDAFSSMKHDIEGHNAGSSSITNRFSHFVIQSLHLLI